MGPGAGQSCQFLSISSSRHSVITWLLQGSHHPHPTPTTMCHVGLRIVGVGGLEARATCFRDLARLTGRRETTKEHFYSRVLKQSSSGHLGLCVGSGL